MVKREERWGGRVEWMRCGGNEVWFFFQLEDLED